MFLISCDEKPEDGDIDCDQAWFRDIDGDGHGTGSPTIGCAPGPGYVTQGGDCDDSNAQVSPSNAEICDLIDNDCDGAADEGLAVTYYGDSDGDGFGSDDDTADACAQPSGYCADGGDCDDTDADIRPNATEVCDGLDNNCDGDADNDAVDAESWYDDGDADGYGGTLNRACTQPAGTVREGGDCDDTNPAANPGERETCDGADNDCDGDTDEGDAVGVTAWFADADRDRYGDADDRIDACVRPAGYVPDRTDCDDADPAVNPGAREVCDSIDNDCDGDTDTDDAVDAVAWSIDRDGDGYGASSSAVISCTQPSGYVDNADDCDDSDSSVYPGEDEVCWCGDGVDNDSDGLIDCEDGDCAADAVCSESSCVDNDDNDGDGDTDCLDDDCWGSAACSDTVARARVRGATITGRRVQHRSYSNHYSYTTGGAMGYTGYKRTQDTSWRYTATGVWGSVVIADPVASTRATCTWQLSEARWGGDALVELETSFYSWSGMESVQPYPVDRSGFMLSSGCALSIASEDVLPAYLGWQRYWLSLGDVIEQPFSPSSVNGCGLDWYNIGSSRRSSIFSSWSTTSSTVIGLFTRIESQHGHSADIWASPTTGDWYTPGACGP